MPDTRLTTDAADGDNRAIQDLDTMETKSETEAVNCRLISSNAQRRKWLAVFDEGFDIVCVQEANFIQTMRFDEGYHTMSANREMFIWTTGKHVILKNLSYLQLVEVSLNKKKLIIVHVHLSNLQKERRIQINEIKSDIEHLSLNFHNANIILVGDFNCDKNQLQNIRMTRVELYGSTWRKNPKVQYTTCLDHIFKTESIDLSAETRVTESHHKAILANIQAIANSTSIEYMVMQSHLSKKRTHKLDPSSWFLYPDLPLYGFQGPNKVRWTIKSEHEYNVWIKDYKYKIYKEGLTTSNEWRKALQLCNLRPFKHTSPMLDNKGKVVTSIKDYINCAVAHLEKATGQSWVKYSPHSMYDLDKDDKYKIVNMMVSEINNVNVNKSCGSDGIHPSWIREFDTCLPSDVFQIKDILSNSLTKRNFFSTRLALVPKKRESRL